MRYLAIVLLIFAFVPLSFDKIDDGCFVDTAEGMILDLPEAKKERIDASLITLNVLEKNSMTFISSENCNKTVIDQITYKNDDVFVLICESN